MNIIESALTVAQLAHHGQTYSEHDYFEYHIKGVVELIKQNTDDENVIAAGILHDVVEDSSMTIKGLQSIGHSSETLEIVRLMTKNEGESYMNYLIRLVQSGNRDAALVKYCDMNFNYRNAKTIKHKVKYNMGMDYLEHEFPFLLDLKLN